LFWFDISDKFTFVFLEYHIGLLLGML
jgi:hypothetical protein